MAVCGCGFCSYAIRYHGEPEGTEPVEHVFCTLENWRELEKENLPADRLEIEHDGIFFYAWRCARCNTFMFFNDRWRSIGVYTPNEKFSSEPMKEPFEFGPFWNDFQWFEITEDDITAAEVLTKYPGNLWFEKNEDDITAAEVLTKYPGNLWFEKNEDELRFYTDEACTNCIKQFRRLQVVTPITVKTMSLESFKKMLAHWDDVEFTYHKVYYNFMRESDGSINIWRGQGCQQTVYTADTFDVEEIVNAKIFDDGKSIAQVQAEVEL